MKFKLTLPKIKKNICSVIAAKSLISIMNDIDDSFFFVPIDESRDVFIKE